MLSYDDKAFDIEVGSLRLTLRDAVVEPEFITRRKSVEDIVRVVASFDQEKMLGQARRNFEKAADYQPFVVDEKLKAFFAQIEREL